MEVPRSHPRYRSLLARERLAVGMKKGLVVPQGLIAQGRAEAFDYLLGEKTIPPALRAAKVAAAYLVLAKRPVISVNGNVVALAPKEVVRLAEMVPARIEVNLFYRTEERVKRVSECIKKAGAKEVFGIRPDARIPGLDSKRALCSRDGIYDADVVLVPLEDGDRAQALEMMKKVVLAIDLNPLSRTSLAATVAVTDELTRALTRIAATVSVMRQKPAIARKFIQGFDKEANLEAVCKYMSSRLLRLRA